MVRTNQARSTRRITSESKPAKKCTSYDSICDKLRSEGVEVGLSRRTNREEGVQRWLLLEIEGVVVAFASLASKTELAQDGMCSWIP